MPGNTIHVETVDNSIILMGTVASAIEAQKALDLANGFVNDTKQSSGSPAGVNVSLGGPASGAGDSNQKSSTEATGRVVNSLTIRGLDQVTLRVTVAEIRREIAKQLGVSMSGAGPNGSLTLDNPFAINGALTATQATLNWTKGASTLHRQRCRPSSGKASPILWRSRT